MLSSTDRYQLKLEIASRFHAALLANPNVALETGKGSKAMVVTGGTAVSVVDYASREADLFIHVHCDIPGNGDKH